MTGPRHPRPQMLDALLYGPMQPLRVADPPAGERNPISLSPVGQNDRVLPGKRAIAVAVPDHRWTVVSASREVTPRLVGMLTDRKPDVPEVILAGLHAQPHDFPTPARLGRVTERCLQRI